MSAPLLDDDGRASIEDVAAMDFEPWTHQPGEFTPPRDASEWAALADPHAANLRMAWLSLYKTKPELVEFVSVAGGGAGQFVVQRIETTTGFLRQLLKIMEVAEARYLCACASYAVTGAAVRKRR